MAEESPAEGTEAPAEVNSTPTTEAAPTTEDAPTTDDAPSTEAKETPAPEGEGKV